MQMQIKITSINVLSYSTELVPSKLFPTLFNSHTHLLCTTLSWLAVSHGPYGFTT